MSKGVKYKMGGFDIHLILKEFPHILDHSTKRANPFGMLYMPILPKRFETE